MRRRPMKSANTIHETTIATNVGILSAATSGTYEGPTAMGERES